MSSAVNTRHIFSEDSIPLLKVSLDSRDKKYNVGIKPMIALFILFIIIVSELFVNNVLAKIAPTTVKGRNITTCGIVVQGILLVFFFSVILTAMNHQLL
jgi:hypothetical protein